MSEKKQIVLSPAKLPAVPSARAKDPSTQRVHDAVKEVIETMRGSRGDGMDRAVFIRDLVATGLLDFDRGRGTLSPGSSIPPIDDGTVVDGTIPPLLENIIATAGFRYILLTWNDPHYRPLAYYEVWRRKIVDPSDSPGYAPEDARMTSTEQNELAALLDQPNKTAQEVRLMNALADLEVKTSDYDYAKNAHESQPTNTALTEAWEAAGEALLAARLTEQVARGDSTSGATVRIAVTPAPVYSDAADAGTTYLYWVRAVSTEGIPGPFNANGVRATTQRDISEIIDELTELVNNGTAADLIFNGPLNNGSGLTLLEALTELEAIANQAREDASDALSAVISSIPPSIWQAIHDLYNTLAGTVLNSIIDGFEQTKDVSTLHERVSDVQTTVTEVVDETAAMAAQITEVTAQFDTQFAAVNEGMLALADVDSALAAQVTNVEAAVYDPSNGVLAAHGRIDDVLSVQVDRDSVLVQSFEKLNAEVGEAKGQIADILTLAVAPDSVLATSLRELEGNLTDARGKITDLLALNIAPDSVFAVKLTQLDGQIGETQGKVQDILELNITPDSALGLKLTNIEASVADTTGSISDLLALRIDPTTALAGKLTQLDLATDYATGAIDDMLTLRFTSDDFGNTALAGALQDFTVQMAGLESTVQNYTYNQLQQLKDADGNLIDPVGRAGWGIRVEQTLNGQSYISGIGINQDIYENADGSTEAFSEVVIAADRFAIIDPDNPNTSKNSPFIVSPDPDDPTGPPKVWIRDAMISRATIQGLIAGSVIADAVRVGAFIQTANLYTPQINIGTWELPEGADPLDIFAYTYNPLSGRQGNFSVDASGVMHANTALLRACRIEDINGNLILDAGLGAYSLALALNGPAGGAVPTYEASVAGWWDFRSSTESWTATGYTLSTTVDTMVCTGGATAIPSITSPAGLVVDGRIFNKVRARVRRTAGTGGWTGNLYYATSTGPGGGHAVSAGYYKQVAHPNPDALGSWFTIEWDMETLAAGGTDWSQSTISQIAFILGGGTNTTWEVDWIAIGRYGTGGWTRETVNTANPITANNIGTYVQNLAVDTLHIAGNAITVPQFVHTPAPASATFTPTSGSSWENLTSITVNIPVVGLDAADLNIPIMITWTVEMQGQNNNAHPRLWRVRRDTGASAVVVWASTNSRDQQDFVTGQCQATVNAGTSHTFYLQTQGTFASEWYAASISTVTVRR